MRDLEKGVLGSKSVVGASVPLPEPHLLQLR